MESRGEDRKKALGRRMEVGADEGGVRGESRKKTGEGMRSEYEGWLGVV